MQNEQGPAASSASTTTPSITSMTTCMVTTSSTGRPHISVYGGIPDRHTVQVIQQALHRQPSTAAQYLQQMYAAQQQHLMLQTAAFQQQQQQLQSLAAVQQASLVAGRQSSNQNAPSQQTRTTINLTTPQAAAQLISRAQSVSSASTGIPQQAVLLGNTSSPALTASQAQMYLRAQMLIFTPTAAVAAVQSEALAQSTANQQSANAQVQSLAIHSHQGTPSSFLSQPHLQALCLKQTPGGAQLSLPSVQLRNPTQQGAQPGGKAAPQEAPSEGGQTGEGPVELTARLVSVSRSVTAVSSHPLISPGTAYAQIQTHQLLQQHKQQQYVIQQQRQIQQQQSHLPQQTQAPVLHTTSLHTQAHMLQALAIQPHPQTRQGLVTVLPKPPVPIQQATIFHSTVSPQMLAHNGPSLTQHHNGPTQNWPTQTIEPNAKPLQLAAVNLQIQPTAPSSASQLTLVQDSTSKIPPLPGVVMETNSTSFVQQPSATPTREATTTEQCPSDPSNPTTHSQGKWDAEGLNAKPPGAGSAPVMTSGNGNNAPTVTGSTPQNGENKPPQAIVKPQILTHVIEGFVIQEGAEPFPVEHPSLLIEYPKKQKQHSYSDSEKQPQSNPCNTTDSDMDLSQQELKEQEEPTLSCELCGRVDFAYNFKRSKRFCSTVCAKRYNVGCTKRVGLFPNRTTLEKLKKQRASNGNHQNSSPEAKKQTPTSAQQPVGGSASSARHHSYPRQGESSHCSDMSSYEGPPSPLSAASSGALGLQTGRGPEHREVPLFSQHHFLASNPAKWNVEDVYEFICSLPGCLEIAEEFRSQEIDGQALLLLKEDHLMATMNIKLGPALKIYAQISMLKDS